MSDDLSEMLMPSMRASLVLLYIGQSYSKAKRLDVATILGSDIVTATAQLRSTLSAAVRRASQQTGFVYTVETGEVITMSGAILCVAVATRLS